jgi:hypothetical protein
MTNRPVRWASEEAMTFSGSFCLAFTSRFVIAADLQSDMSGCRVAHTPPCKQKNPLFVFQVVHFPESELERWRI